MINSFHILLSPALQNVENRSTLIDSRGRAMQGVQGTSRPRLLFDGIGRAMLLPARRTVSVCDIRHTYYGVYNKYASLRRWTGEQ